MRVDEIEVGDEVRLAFLDHASGTTRVMPCVAYGRVLQVNAASVVIEPWICEGDDDCQTDNNDRYAIVKAAIQAVVALRFDEGENDTSD